MVVFTSDHGHFLGQHGLIAKGAFHYEDVVKVPFVVRWPGCVPAGRRSDGLQSLVDLAPTFLSAAAEAVPGTMSGRDQLPVWRGETERVRDHVRIENRHQPTALHLETYVDERYKLTVYRAHDYGELFDLQDDPGERCNLWDDPAARDLKTGLLLRFAQSAMSAQPLPMPRLAGA